MKNLSERKRKMSNKNNLKRKFMKPGKTNQEDRNNFIKYWADYIKTHEDSIWGEQQALLINSQICE